MINRSTDHHHRNWNGNELQERGVMRGGGHRCRSLAYGGVERWAGIRRTDETPPSGNIGERRREKRGQHTAAAAAATADQQSYNRYLKEIDLIQYR